MSKHLLLACLFVPFTALTAGADAPPEPPPPPPAHAIKPQPAACKGGDVLISNEHQNLGVDVGSAGITIWDKGAVHVYSHDPKAMRDIDVMTCLTDQERKDLRALLAKAPWKVTTSDVTCDAIAAMHTVWKSGKHSFDERLCGREAIDAETKKALAFVTKLETAYAKTVPAPPPTPGPKPTGPKPTR